MSIITPFSLLLYPAKLLKLKINLKDLQEYITMSIYTHTLIILKAYRYVIILISLHEL